MGEFHDLGRLYASKLQALVDTPFCADTINRASGLTAEYARQVRARWGIETKPVVLANHDLYSIEAYLEPVDDFNKLMWDRMDAQPDLKPWMVDQRAIAA